MTRPMALFLSEQPRKPKVESPAKKAGKKDEDKDDKGEETR